MVDSHRLEGNKNKKVPFSRRERARVERPRSGRVKTLKEASHHSVLSSLEWSFLMKSERRYEAQSPRNIYIYTHNHRSNYYFPPLLSFLSLRSPSSLLVIRVIRGFSFLERRDFVSYSLVKTRRKRVIIRLLNHSQPRQIALGRVSLAESCVFPPSSSRRIGERGLNYRKKLQQVSRVMDGVIWLICLAICVDDDFCLGF